MITVGENHWTVIQRLSIEIGVMTLAKAAERHNAGDFAGECEWRKIIRRADALVAIVGIAPSAQRSREMGDDWQEDRYDFN